MTERERAMTKVRMYHFPLIEATLFLDTHPNDRSALEYFKRMKDMYEKAVNEYTMKFGPISARDVSDDASGWTWVKGPWPWEGEK